MEINIKDTYYVGARCSGKTVKLLNRAQELVKEGYIPVFLCFSKDYARFLNERATSMGLDTDKMYFITNLDDKDTLGKVDLAKRVLLIDEIQLYLRVLLGSPVIATIDEDSYNVCKRTDWDK